MELHQLFQDMAILIDAQGELLNEIEINVSTSAAYVKDGNRNLRDANKYLRKSRKVNTRFT
jgi:syntaxin 1B/2/3